MADLVALKVKIGKRIANGDMRIDYPDFGRLQVVKDSGLRWQSYVDNLGSGWQYDRLYGHNEVGPDSPAGTWLGVICVPKDFAVQAVAIFPERCEIISEVDLETFWSDRVAVREPDIRDDPTVLQAIANKRALGIKEDQDDLDALDPEKPMLGRVQNPRKTWKRFKAQRGMTIDKTVNPTSRT